MYAPRKPRPKALSVLSLDLVPYSRALGLQRAAVRARREGRVPDTLLLLRHPPVITLGRRGDEGNILVPRESLAERGIEVHRTERGGDVTYHGPGQLIGYPILDLADHRKDVGWYMHSLEEVLVRTLRDLGISGQRLPGHIGVWLDEQRKIASLGVRIERWITYHGFALNVDEESSHFSLIVPCGLVGRQMTSVEAVLGKPVDISRIREHVVSHFCGLFDLTVEEMDADEPLDPASLEEALLGTSDGVHGRGGGSSDYVCQGGRFVL